MNNRKNKTLTFRFDIDTHKCIRDGVPRLLELSSEMGVPFSFFLNCGCAISRIGSLKNIVNRGIGARNEEEYYENKAEKKCVKCSEPPQMMSALQKLGLKDYLKAAVLNPRISSYKDQIERLLDSNCEVGLHGGRNHATWGSTEVFDKEKTKEDITWGLNQLKAVKPDFMPYGFASPEWNNPDFLPEMLKDMGFLYYADYRCVNVSQDARRPTYLNSPNDMYGDSRATDNPMINDGALPLIGVNLLGEPGGVAFFEWCRVRGLSADEIVDMVIDKFKEVDNVVLYDHPYYAGMHEIETMRLIINRARGMGVRICRLIDLIQK